MIERPTRADEYCLNNIALSYPAQGSSSTPSDTIKPYCICEETPCGLHEIFSAKVDVPQRTTSCQAVYKGSSAQGNNKYQSQSVFLFSTVTTKYHRSVYACPCIIGAAIFLCPIAAGPSRESGSIIIVNHKDVDDFECLTLPNSMISVFCCPTVRRHEVQVSHRLSEALPTTFNVFSTASPSAPWVLARFDCIPITDCHDSALVFDLRPDHTTTRHE